MRLTVANISNEIRPQDFQVALSALRRQALEDFGPEWSVNATLRGITRKLKKGDAPIEGIHDAIIYLGDSSKDPNGGVADALGYHSANHANLPFGFVYLNVCKEYGEDWTVTLSHEVLELLADPCAALTVAGPHPAKAGKSARYDLEVCDPTQGDTYFIDNVKVSNFVTKRYFDLPGGTPAKTNFLGLELKPFGVRPSGYLQYEDSHGSHQIDGERLSPQRKAARAMLDVASGRTSGRRNARRALRDME
jgi:hypothetical protein